MAETKKNTTKKKSTAVAEEATAVVAEVKETKREPERPIVPKDVDPSTIVTVLNGFQGGLIYKSPRTGERYEWDGFGDEQEMELRELRNAKSSKKDFFINNWFLFPEEYAWVVDYLGVAQYYKNAINYEDFDGIFKKTPDEIATLIAGLSEGQRRSVSYRARQLVMDGTIDSRKMIKALEDALGVELIEK